MKGIWPVRTNAGVLVMVVFLDLGADDMHILVTCHW